MQTTGRLTGITVDFVTGKLNVTFQVDTHPVDELNELAAMDSLDITVKKHKQKRSLDANAYFWVLCDRLSEKMNLPKEEIYKGYIKGIGGVSEVVCVQDKAVDRLCSSWSHNGIGWQTETFPSKIDGCTNVILYYGSSTYDAEQMSRLIDMLIHDCNAQGIPTITEEQYEELITQWGKKYEKRNAD